MRFVMRSKVFCMGKGFVDLGHQIRSIQGGGSKFAVANLRIRRNEKPATPSAKEKLVFGQEFTDHMLTVKWTAGAGWDSPEIVPFGNLSLSPASSVLHYGFECFEGMKAYRGQSGEIRLFRPLDNLNRLNISSKRLGLPEFEPETALGCLSELVRLDSKWVPAGAGYSLYIRPTMIGTEATLGVKASRSAMLYAILSPCGPYFPTGFTAVNLYANTDAVRAWPGGTGDKKIGGNYAPTVLPQSQALEYGCQQVLWTIGENRTLMEAGTMNLFVFWKNKLGDTELVTPPLDGTILPGIVRDSILQICRQWGEFKVSERTITLGDIEDAHAEHRLLEMFGSGTACVVSPVKSIVSANSPTINVPLDPANPRSEAGPLAARVYKHLIDIQYGATPSAWSIPI